MTHLVKISDITQLADSLAKSLRANLRWSTQLRKSVKIGKAKEIGDTVSINIQIGVGTDRQGKPLTGMARAYEFGSGIHATRGRRGTYIIRPVNKKRLAFAWPKATPPFRRGKKLAGQLPDGKLSFFYVEHPGVEQREYIEKSKQSILPKVIPELAIRIRQNVKNELKLAIKGIKS